MAVDEAICRASSTSSTALHSLRPSILPLLFSQIEIAEEDKPKIAFRDANDRLWEYSRCGFGLKIIPGAFANCTAVALEPVKGHGVENWLDDDLIISTKTFDDHPALLGKTLEYVFRYGLSVNFQKSHWRAPSQEFVGMIVDRYGIRPADSRLDVFRQFSIPCNV